jgi:hypothetical protein
MDATGTSVPGGIWGGWGVGATGAGAAADGVVAAGCGWAGGELRLQALRSARLASAAIETTRNLMRRKSIHRWPHVQYESVPAGSTPPGTLGIVSLRRWCWSGRRRVTRSRCSWCSGRPWFARCSRRTRCGRWNNVGSRRAWRTWRARCGRCCGGRCVIIGTRRRIVLVASNQNQRRSRKDECIEYIRLHDIPSKRFCGAEARRFTRHAGR